MGWGASTLEDLHCRRVSNRPSRRKQRRRAKGRHIEKGDPLAEAALVREPELTDGYFFAGAGMGAGMSPHPASAISLNFHLPSTSVTTAMAAHLPFTLPP